MPKKPKYPKPKMTSKGFIASAPDRLLIKERFKQVDKWTKIYEGIGEFKAAHIRNSFMIKYSS